MQYAAATAVMARDRRWWIGVFIACYVSVVVFAIVARVEAFPLTWAPMYANKKTFWPPKDSYVLAPDYYLTARRQDGKQEQINARTLNVAQHSFRRIATSRIDSKKWGPALLEPVNVTLGRKEGRKDFITKLTSTFQKVKFKDGKAPELRKHEASCSVKDRTKARKSFRPKSWQHPSPNFSAGIAMLAAIASAMFGVHQLSRRRHPLASRIRKRWSGFWFADRNRQSLEAFRIVVCGSFFVWMLFGGLGSWRWAMQLDLAGPHFHFLSPIWYFDAFGVENQVPVVSSVAYVIGLVAAFFAAVGIRARVAIGVLIVCIFWLKGARGSQAGDLHHREYLWAHALGILMVSKCGVAYAFRSTRESVAPWEAHWPLRLVQVYAALFFFAAGIAKLRVTGLDWLHGETLRGLFIGRSVREGGVDVHDFAWWLGQHPALCSALSVAAIAMELAFPLTLLARRNSPWLLAFLATVVVFHAANMVLASVEFLSTSVLLLAFVDTSPVIGAISRLPLPVLVTRRE